MIKNYTSEVSVSKSLQHIEDVLIAHGAKTVIKMAENNKVTGIAFVVTVNGKDIPFKIPAKIDRVELQLKKMIKRPRKGTSIRCSDQAARTAWKILSDWVDIQISLIELDQVEITEVFLPYVYDPIKNKTFFESAKDNNFKLIA